MEDPYQPPIDDGQQSMGPGSCTCSDGPYTSCHVDEDECGTCFAPSSSSCPERGGSTGWWYCNPVGVGTCSCSFASEVCYVYCPSDKLNELRNAMRLLQDYTLDRQRMTGSCTQSGSVYCSYTACAIRYYEYCNPEKECAQSPQYYLQDAGSGIKTYYSCHYDLRKMPSFEWIATSTMQSSGEDGFGADSNYNGVADSCEDGRNNDCDNFCDVDGCCTGSYCSNPSWKDKIGCLANSGTWYYDDFGSCTSNGVSFCQDTEKTTEYYCLSAGYDWIYINGIGYCDAGLSQEYCTWSGQEYKTINYVWLNPDNDCGASECTDIDGDRYSLQVDPNTCNNNCGGLTCLGGGDCDDYDDSVFLELVGYRDFDVDNYYNKNSETLCTDGNLPSGYRLTQGNDCDDDTSDDPSGCPTLPSGCSSSTSTCAICIHPTATEICSDLVDNECDNLVDCLDIGDCGADPNCLTCKFNGVNWNQTKVNAGEVVAMIVSGTDCDASDFINFTIYEYDGTGDDLILKLQTPYDRGAWVSTWTYSANEYGPGMPAANDDDSGDGDREYYFTAVLSNNVTVTKSSTKLNVSKPLGDCFEEGGLEVCHPETETSVCLGNTIPSTTTPGECCDQTCCILSDVNSACTTEYGADYECGTASRGCGWIADCGTCSGSDVCVEGTCCTPDCSGKVCGDNGCGGSCGSCPPNTDCISGQCWDVNICAIINASWDRNYAWADSEAYLRVFATPKCEGETVNFQVWLNDPTTWIEDDKIGGYDPDPEVFSGGYAQGTWIAEYHSSNSELPEYFFKVFTDYGDTNSKEHSGFQLLSVNTTDCSGIMTCGDYNTPEECTNNICSGIVISNEEDINKITCGDQCETQDTWFECGCMWNNNDNVCEFAYTQFQCDDYVCGNNIIEPGESCDSTNYGGMTCADFGLSGTGLACNNCEFDVSGCTGFNCHVNGTIEYGSEVCDGLNFTKSPTLWIDSEIKETWECSDFDDFDSGTLICTDNCQIDTSACRRDNTNKDFKIGSCTATQNSVITCDEDPIGFYVTSWGGEWTPGHEDSSSSSECAIKWEVPESDCKEFVNLWYYDPDNKIQDCTDGGESVIECPAEIRLGFFNYYNLAVTILLIGLIYLVGFVRKR